MAALSATFLFIQALISRSVPRSEHSRFCLRIRHGM